MKLFLKSNRFFSVCYDIFGCKTVFRKKFGHFTAHTKSVFYANAYNGNGTSLAKSFAYSAAKTAYNAMLFSSNNSACLCRRFNDDIFIKGFDSMYIDNLCGNTFCFKLFCSFKSKCTIRPVATIVTSVPSASFTPLPSSNL